MTIARISASGSQPSTRFADVLGILAARRIGLFPAPSNASLPGADRQSTKR